MIFNVINDFDLNPIRNISSISNIEKSGERITVYSKIITMHSAELFFDAPLPDSGIA